MIKDQDSEDLQRLYVKIHFSILTYRISPNISTRCLDLFLKGC